MKKFFSNHKFFILFFLILVVAIFFRFYNLTLVPPSASLDEATIGWNAYSILHTGHGEYGGRGALPVLLRAYDDYRPALYVYLVIPFIQLFGLSVLAIRLPSVIMSVATVAMSFFLIKSMLFFYKKKDSIAIVSMALLAISPWHIYLSRLGHEVNLGLTLVVLGSLLFFKFIENKNHKLLIWSFVIFALGFYSYQSEKLFIPLFVFLLLCVFYKQVLAARKTLILGVILAITIAFPMVISTLSPTGLIRLHGTSVFTDNHAYDQSAKALLLAKENHNILGQILSNRRITTVKIFATNYLSHFSPWWLFGNSGDESFKAPNTGLLYLWELPFLYIGLLFFLFNKKVTTSVKIVIVFWVLVDFLAPGITTQAPHAMRAFTLIPVPSLLIAFGILFSIDTINNKISRSVAFASLFVVAVLVVQSVSAFFYNYFELFPVMDSRSFQYALQRAIPYVNQNKSQYQHIVISNSNNLYQSYMFYLFNSKFDPVLYAKMGGTKSGGFAATHMINTIVFRPINWDKESKQSTLFIGNPQDFPSALPNAVTFYYLNGVPGVTIVGEK